MADRKVTRWGDVLYYRGKNYSVEWYFMENGELPGLDHYKGMDETSQDRLDYMVRYMADAEPGTFLPSDMYRVEDARNRIFAFKPRAERFFNFITAGRKIIITNAYRKHSQKMEKKDRRVAEKAAEYRADYLRRTKEGRYYESIKG